MALYPATRGPAQNNGQVGSWMGATRVTNDATVWPALWPATSVRAAFRTQDAYAHRDGSRRSATVRVAYQLHDSFGNVRIQTSGLEVRMLLSLSGTASTVMVNCQLPSQHFSQRYLGACEVPAASLPEATWFQTGATRAATATITVFNNGQAEAGASDVAVAGTLTMHARPGWYEFNDGSINWLPDTLGNAAVGVYATLPVSPVLAQEDFIVHVWANTGSGTATNALTSWFVIVTIDKSRVSLRQWSTDSNFIPAQLSETGNDLQFIQVGLAPGVADSAVNGRSVKLLTLTLFFNGGTPANPSHPGVQGANLISLNAVQFVNPGLNPFVNNRPGYVLDHRPAWGPSQASGEMVVQAVASTALFGYGADGAGALANLDVITGTPTSHALTIFSVTNESLWSFSDVTNAACSSPADGTNLHLSGCTVILNSSYAPMPDPPSTVVIAQSGGMQATIPLIISGWSVSDLNLVIVDSTLNRIPGTAGQSCGAPQFQWTTIRLEVGGLDATSIAPGFEVDNTYELR